MNNVSYKSGDFATKGKQNQTMSMQRTTQAKFNTARPKSRDRHICGWQGQILGKIDGNKVIRTKKERQPSLRKRTDEDDYNRILYKLKKQAEFLESDEEQRIDSGKKKTRFPTQSDITELISKQTKYFPSKASCGDIKDQKHQITLKQRQLLMNNSSVYLCEHSKRNFMRPSGLFIKMRNRPATSNPGIEVDQLLITSLKSDAVVNNQQNFQPIHTATRLRSRHRRKVRSVTDSFDIGCEATAGLVGNAASLKPKHTTNNFVGEPIQSGFIMFRKYNQIVKGKKLRTHRVSTVAS